jgi:hypothetical protein
VRRYAQAQAYDRLHAEGPGPYGAEQIAAVLDDVGSALR